MINYQLVQVVFLILHTEFRINLIHAIYYRGEILRVLRIICRDQPKNRGSRPSGYRLILCCYTEVYYLYHIIFAYLQQRRIVRIKTRIVIQHESPCVFLNLLLVYDSVYIKQ
jgi:hypothetical protein